MSVPSPSAPAAGEGGTTLDLRAVVLAGAAWLGAGRVVWASPAGASSDTAWAVSLVGVAGALLVMAALPAAVLARRLRRSGDRVATGLAATATAVVLVGTAAAASALLQTAPLRDRELAGWAEDGVVGTATAVLVGETRRIEDRHGIRLSVRADLVRLAARGRERRLRAPVLLVGGSELAGLGNGARLTGTVRLAPSRDRRSAAIVAVIGRPVVRAAPTGARAVAAVRHAIRSSALGTGLESAVLVPALVDGDDTALPDRLREEFAVTGMTHLLAVSGTNLTLILTVLMAVVARLGIGGYARIGVGALGVGGFVLLCGAEPSVLRAAAMGVIGLLALRRGPARARAARGLAVGVLVLLLISPGLAGSAGFALSVAATAGILAWAGAWADALDRWLPRPIAEATGVTLAAQLACTPLLVVLTGQLSVVAPFANLLAAPLVAPVTILGLVGGLLGLIAPSIGAAVCYPAGLGAAALVAIARAFAVLPRPAIAWSAAPLPVLVLSGLAVAFAVRARRLFSRPATGLVAVAVLIVAVAVPAPSALRLPWSSWPPRGWLMVACDVGQGDALVLRTGADSAVVVDAGPDPGAVDRCLDRLRVRTVPVVVLTHFHADHVDGLGGVLRGREVGGLEVSPLAEPGYGAALVQREAAAGGRPVRVAKVGERTRVGPVSWEVLAPVRVPQPGSASPPNDASVVLLVSVAGVRLLLLGDEEEPAQRDLLASRPDLRVDVVKIAHHGSAAQEPGLWASLGARIAVISVGAGNDYGHPAPSTLSMIASTGAVLGRTDRDGDLAVVARSGLPGGIGLVARGG